jgi:RNA polymerase sigma factor (sigma-70 family)
MTTAATTMTPRAREEKNLKFANDGSLASVEALLYKTAMKCYARVAAMGLGMDFDDVHQEMRVSYVKALSKWKPEGGARFSTYCTTVCINNFNHAIMKMARERVEMGMVSYSASFVGEAGATVDPLEIMHSAAAPECDSPEYRTERSQQMKANLARLSMPARRLVALLLKYEQMSSLDGVKLRELAKMAQLEGAELRRVKLEILKVFGVQWN